jgi:hypothetical protein
MMSVMLLVVFVRAGERRRGHGHRERSREQKDEDLLHLYPSNRP